MKRDRNTFFENPGMTPNMGMINPSMYPGSMASPNMYQGMNNYNQPPNYGALPTNTYPTEITNNIEARLAKIERQILRIESRILKIENTTVTNTGNYVASEDTDVNINNSMYMI